MKKFAIIAISALLVLSLAACKTEQTVENKQETPPVIEIPPVEKEEKPEINLNIKPLEETDAETLKKSAEKFGFTNINLFHSFANAIGKKPSEVTQKDIDDVHYIALGPDVEGGYSVFVGSIEYVDFCLSDAAYEEDFQVKANDLLVKSKFDYDENESLYDLANFKNIESFEIYNVKIDDVSFIKAYNKLIYGYFNNNGITDVSSLKGYAPETLRELDFTGNEVSDWSSLEPIKEKVYLFYDINNGASVTLKDYFDQKDNPAPETPKTEQDEKTDEAPVLYDENGNVADFSSLFD